MINNFGPAHPTQPGQVTAAGGAQTSQQHQRGGADTKSNEEPNRNQQLLQEKERLDAKEKIQGALSPSKQISAQKGEMAGKNAGVAHAKQGGSQTMNVKGNSSVSFKQSFKPQKIGLLNDMRRLQEVINSRGVTPSNALQIQVPLISASNLLLGGAAHAQ